MVHFKVNGHAQTFDGDPEMPLLWYLRDILGLTGTKFGCGMALCGACTVLVDNEPVFSCITPAAALQNSEIVTLEGLGTVNNPAPIQKAFIEEQAAQCGYCIAAMMMRAQALLMKNPAADEKQIRAWLEPNLCRCGTHMRILRAVVRTGRMMQQMK